MLIDNCEYCKYQEIISLCLEGIDAITLRVDQLKWINESALKLVELECELDEDFNPDNPNNPNPVPQTVQFLLKKTISLLDFDRDSEELQPLYEAIEHLASIRNSSHCDNLRSRRTKPSGSTFFD